MANAAPKARGSWTRWIVAVVVVVLVLVVGGPFVYFHFIEGKAPAPLSINDATTSTLKSGPSRARRAAGAWKIARGSLVRYRVKETLFDQSHTTVGGTNSITGSMTIAGTKVTTASFTVDMTSITSDSAERDGQFQGRIMDTSDFPTAKFVLTSPISLGSPPTDAKKTYTAVGKLTLHGTTKTVTLAVQALRSANMITVVGSTPITFSDYNIDNPSGGPASVGNAGTLEFMLQFQPTG